MIKRGAVLFILAVVIFISALAVYANAVSGSFICDDIILIRDNNHIKSFAYIDKMFTMGIGAGYRMTKAYAYRPIQMLSYAIDYSLYRLNSAGYHIGNILIHASVAVALLWLVFILSGSIPTAFAAAMIFTLHPLQTESVAYIASRADPLSALFVILGVYFYVKASDINSTPGSKGIQSRGLNLNLVLMCASYCLAILSREGSVVMPFLAAACSYSFKRRLNKKALVMLAVLTAAYAAFRGSVVAPSITNTYYGISIWQRLPGVFAALTDYMRLVLLPLGLHMEYGNRVFAVFSPKVLCGVVIFALSAAYLIYRRKQRGGIYFCVLWFYIALAPQLNIFPITAYLAEHWLYLPLAGLAAIAGAAFASGWADKRLKAISVSILIALLVSYSALTIRQNRAWHDAMSFYKNTLKYAPDSARMNNDFSVECMRRGLYDDAEKALRKALEIQPIYPDAMGNLANVYKRAGRFEEAADLYKRSIELAPYNVTSYYNLGILYFFEMNRPEEAIAIFEKAVSIDPSSAEALHNLALAYSKTGRQEEAISLYKRALLINPDIGETHMELGYLYYSRGDYGKAYEHLRAAQSLGVKVDESFLKFAGEQR